MGKTNKLLRDNNETFLGKQMVMLSKVCSLDLLKNMETIQSLLPIEVILINCNLGFCKT